MQEVAGLSEERQQKTREMEALSQRREALSQKTAQCQSIYDQNELRTQMLSTQLEEAKRDTQMIGQSIEKNERFLEEVRLELEQKQQAYQEEADRMKAIQEREEEDRKKEEEMRSQILRVRIELSTSEQLIASMMNSGEREAADMRQDEEQIERYEERLKEAEREMGRLESEALRSEAELGQVGNQIQAFGEKIEELTQVRDDKEEQRRESIVASEEVVQWVTDLEKEQYRLDTQASRVKKELAELQDRIWEKYELTYNAALRLELPKLENVNAANRRMSELREELRGLGAVNLHAVEEYQTLKERCDFLTSQLEDVKKAEESLRDIIRQLTEQLNRLKGIVICPQCGREASREEKFCAGCGTRLPEAEQKTSDKMKQDAREAASEAGDIVDDMAGKAKDFFGNMADKADAFMKGMTSKKSGPDEKDIVEGTAREVEEAAQKAEETVKEAAAEAEEIVEEAAAKAEEAVKEAASEAEEAVEEAAAKAEEIKEEAADGAPQEEKE